MSGKCLTPFPLMVQNGHNFWRATTAKPSGVSRSPPGFASPLRELSPED